MNPSRNLLIAVTTIGILALPECALSADAPKPPSTIAPTHPAAQHAAPALSDNSSVPATSLLSLTGVLARLTPDAPVSKGVLSGSRLIPFSTFNPEIPIGGRIDGTIASGRQVWELTYAFPAGVTMRVAQLGPDAKAVVAIDAATGTFLAAKWSGTVVTRIGGPRHS